MSGTNKVLRLLKTGGYSWCSSPEHLVGRGRCNHIPGMCFQQKTNENGCRCVEISSLSSNDNIPKVTVKQEDLNNYVKELDSQLSKEKKDKILDFFRTYN